MSRSTPRVPQVRVHATRHIFTPRLQNTLIAALLCALLAALPGLSQAASYPPILQPYLNKGLKV